MFTRAFCSTVAYTEEDKWILIFIWIDGAEGEVLSMCRRFCQHIEKG